MEVKITLNISNYSVFTKERECSGSRLKENVFLEVVPAVILVWKFPKVVASVLLLGQDVVPQTFLPVVCL